MPKQSKTFEFIRAHPTIQAKEEQNRSFFSSRRNSRSEGTDQSAFFQAKLTINEPGDQYERQADAMANRVMRMPAPLGEEEESLQAKPLPNSTLQRKCAECEEEEQVQRQAVEEEEEPLQTKPLMRKTSEGGYSASPQLASQLNSSKGGGNPLPRPTLATMNQAFGVDFSNVRVHTGSQAEGMSQGIQARAFTHGSDIYFNRGEYSPESLEGKRLLGHELTHVVQQGGGILRELSPTGSPENEINIQEKEMPGRYNLLEKIQRQASNLDPDCEDLLTQIIARVYELISRASALQSNPLNLPQSGPMSIEGHQQQFRNKQVNLRRMLEQWDTNNCGDGLPPNAWQWATRPVPRPIPVPPSSSSPRQQIQQPQDGTQVTPRDVAVAVGGTAAAVGAGYVIYRVVRFLPSLLPPLWWTIPANAAIP